MEYFGRLSATLGSMGDSTHTSVGVSPQGDAPLSRATIVRYAVGSVGTGGFGTLPGLVLIYFLTDTLGVAAGLAGLVVIASKVVDVLIDPVIGDISDASARRRGTRGYLMWWGALALPVFFVLTFAVPPGLEGAGAALWVMVAFIGCAVGFSLFQVPYIALPVELTGHYDERTRLLAWRVVVLSVAILLFGGGGPVLRSLGGDNQRLGYVLMAVVAGLVIGLGFAVAAKVAPRRPPQHAPRGTAELRHGSRLLTGRMTRLGSQYRAGLDTLRTNQPFRVLVLTFFLQAAATGIMLAGAQYVATWVLDSEAAVTFLFVALIAPAVIMSPVWGAVARRVGKEKAFSWASLIFMAGSVSLVLLLVAPGPWVYVPVAVCGAAYAGLQALPMAMLPDTVPVRTESQAGVYGGVWTAGETTGMALGSVALTVVLAATGYIESTATQNVTQPDSAVGGIVVAFSVIPALAVAVSLVSLRAYPLRRADIMAANVKEYQ